MPKLCSLVWRYSRDRIYWSNKLVDLRIFRTHLRSGQECQIVDAYLCKVYIPVCFIERNKLDQVGT